MSTVLSKETLFDAALITDLVSKIRGKSSLAILSNQTPLPFNGTKEFTFTLDSDIDVVAENGKKTHGGVSIDPITIIPIKIEYGARVSDEFLYASEEVKINIMKAFNDGFAKKVARGFDLMAFHGINPRTKTPSSVIGTNHFDAKVDQVVNYNSSDPDQNIESAIAMIDGSDGEVTGIAMSKTFAADLGKMKNAGGVKLYPELAWGGNPGTINRIQIDINSTISNNTVKDRAILGDFENMFKWGYAKEIPFEIIQYGDPDNSGKDLKGYNQVYLRAEMYIGWGILDNKSFARIVEA